MAYQTYAESVISLLKGKFVEIYEGTNGKLQKWSDYENQQKEVIRGVLKGGMGDLLIITVTDDVGNTNDVYINGWSVKTILEPKNNISTVDVYTNEETKQIK